MVEYPLQRKLGNTHRLGGIRWSDLGIKDWTYHGLTSKWVQMAGHEEADSTYVCSDMCEHEWGEVAM